MEGEKGDTFFIILDGQIEVMKAQLIPVSKSATLAPLTDLSPEDYNEQM